MSGTLISIRNLKTYFYTSRGIVKAVDDTSFNVEKGEIAGLVGESGSGKTATALSIMRLVPNPGRIIGGKIIFQDKDILRINESEMRSIRGSRIAMSFQDPMTFLNPVLKVGEQIAESIKLNQRLEKDESMEKAIKTMELVHVSSSRAYDYPHQLSGGMRQRVLLAIAISCKPALLIADEPTTSLDVITQIRILEMLNDLRNKLRISMMLITHDIGVVQKTADKVAVMYAGNILEYGDTRTIIHSPIHPYTRALLESIPKFDQPRLKTIRGNPPDMANPPCGCKFHPRCVYAVEKCKKQRPKLMEIERGHYVACLHFR